MPKFEEWASHRAEFQPKSAVNCVECTVCKKFRKGLCCRYWQAPQDFWFRGPTKEQLDHAVLWGGSYQIKKKFFGILTRVYWIMPVRCTKQLPNGSCGIYERRPQICRDYICAKDEFIGIKKELERNNRPKRENIERIRPEAKKMKACIHQPNYLPYLGILSKIKQCDLYIIYDTAQYVKDRFDNRNQIKTPKGPEWLTVPLQDADSFRKRFFEVKLPENDSWQKKHLRAIEMNYSKAEYFESYFGELKRIYSAHYDYLPEISVALIKFLMKEMEIGTETVQSSKLGLDLEKKSTEAIVEMLGKAGAKGYLAGASGKKYMDIEMLERAGIKVEYQHYEHPTYRQLYGVFIKNLAAIDLLFNEGENSKNYV